MQARRGVSLRQTLLFATPRQQLDDSRLLPVMRGRPSWARFLVRLSDDCKERARMPLIDGHGEHERPARLSGEEATATGCSCQASKRGSESCTPSGSIRRLRVPSYDNVEKSSVWDKASSIDKILAENTVTTGLGLGPDWKPTGWSRLLWRTLADRFGMEVDFHHPVPIQAFNATFPDGSWPISIQPPTTGSLDWESFASLMPILMGHTDSTLLYRVDTWRTWTGDPFEYALRHGSPDEMLETYDGHGDFGSGANWWPDDQSWLVYSDYGLTTTIVQSPPTVSLARSQATNSSNRQNSRPSTPMANRPTAHDRAPTLPLSGPHDRLSAP